MKKNNDNNDTNNPFADNSYTEELAQETADANAVTMESEELQKDAAKDSNSDVKEKYDALNNQYIRLAADFDNYRKRQEQERDALLKYGTEDALKKMLEVLDNFDRAKKAVNDTENCETMKETFLVLEKQTLDALAKMGLSVIETEGQKFDPNFHEAVMQTQTDEYPEETIIKELQKGYKMGEKVIRPAFVDVAVQ